MLFDEVLKLDEKFSAFKDWMTVFQAKKEGIIPTNFHEYFEDDCQCGSENIINRELTQLMCCNPKCKIKQGFALAEMFHRFGIKGLGSATCSSIYSSLLDYDRFLKNKRKSGLFETNSYVEVLKLNWSDYPSHLTNYIKVREFFEACCVIRNSKVTFPKLVSNLGLVNLNSVSMQMLGDIDSFDELMDKIESCGGISIFCALHNQWSPMFRYNFYNSLEDIGVASYICSNRRKIGVLHLKVTMTGRCICRGKSMTKDSFIEALNKLCADKNGTQLLEITRDEGVRTNSFVLYSLTSNDNKYRIGKQRGSVTDEFGNHPVLMRADDFYNVLERLMIAWNEQIELCDKENLYMLLENLMKTSMTSVLKEMNLF